MGTGTVIVAVAGLVVALVLVVCLLCVLRIRWIWSRGAVFECQLRQEQPVVRPWHSGLARYEGNRLGWYRVLSLGYRPNVVIHRRRTELLGHRPPDDKDLNRLTAGQEVVAITQRSGQDESALWHLGMDVECLTGFMSWLEAGPPGEERYRAMHQSDRN
ncbi:DUF2550 domain-containing protein [Propionibacterium australiense]|uniref:DUF2550 family protein n=1 Tax=Propionibacterium australiense TaxID=119981 RepID=A0A383S491_9ACTN|nr:DUF2550 domain-containing protein [Propionibacterium australiense]RLP11640.1 DUF2550 family protein [Propionibacterium australiense]RLP12153.1 DUF2550 family protein [Propionibacterium australiense]SYZ32372.1 Protein of unknown function DUF2550 [Propionibacterium australiense]VEH90345.1 Protein of uncharacterised function (DUF2550) [Propionibacterium australiense]